MQSADRRSVVLAAVSGALFAVGLALAGMTQPSKVIQFLDVTGNWDPSLAFVMIGGIGVQFLVYKLAGRRSQPWFGSTFALPTRRDITAPLVIGSALFGVGWGLGGFCPGPGLTSLATGSSAATFVVAMALGMFLFDRYEKARAQ